MIDAGNSPKYNPQVHNPAASPGSGLKTNQYQLGEFRLYFSDDLPVVYFVAAFKSLAKCPAFAGIWNGVGSGYVLRYTRNAYSCFTGNYIYPKIHFKIP